MYRLFRRIAIRLAVDSNALNLEFYHDYFIIFAEP